MTCVLAVTPFHANSFSEDGVDLKNKGFDKLDFDWLNAKHVQSGLSNGHRCSATCGKEASTGSSMSCLVEISNGMSGTTEKGQFYKEGCDTNHKAIELEKPMLVNGMQERKTLFGVCSKRYDEQDHQSTQKCGVKRKIEVTKSEELFVSSKRVSPFLNTPRERQDERMKMLKISIKKLKQLDDPETFLRRTVLVNNTMKRLQMELQVEYLRNKNRRTFSGYGILNNSYMTDSYLFHDPFLSGAHEKITDDMTDTLIHNVFHDQPNDRKKESDDIEQNSDLVSNEMEITGTNTRVVSSLSTYSFGSKDHSYQHPSDSSTNTIKSERRECCLLACFCNRLDVPDMSADMCNEIKGVRRCNLNSTINISNDKIDCSNCEDVHSLNGILSVESKGVHSSTVQKLVQKLYVGHCKEVDTEPS